MSGVLGSHVLCSPSSTRCIFYPLQYYLIPREDQISSPTSLLIVVGTTTNVVQLHKYGGWSRG